jgi:two-component system, OmpR family, sensor histidine kinase KdpD
VPDTVGQTGPMAQADARRLGAWAVGILGTVAIAGICYALPDDLPVAVPALLLLVPISLSSALGGWRIGAVSAVVAAIVYSYVFIDPFGSIAVHLAEDAYVLGAFVAVALVVGVLARRAAPAATAPSGDDPALLDEDRAMLLRSVSHDLRTPLSTIQTVSTDLLESDAYDEDTQRELMAVVASEATRLNRIVGNLLSISRVQAGSFQPEVEETAVEDVVAVAVERYAGQDAVALAVELDPDVSTVLADPVQIDQVLANLLENALRHAPVGSTVTVRASRAGEFVQLTVADEGPGFAPAALEQAFQRPMPSATDARGRSGSGLGLTVCRAIVEAHGGWIVAASAGQGAEVTFSLPIAA